jgi:hypothetical protein
VGTGLPSGLVGYGGDHPHWPRSDVAFDQAQTRPSASCVGVRLAGRVAEISLNSRSTTSRLSSLIFACDFATHMPNPHFPGETLDQPQALHAGMPVLADDEVIVHGNPKWCGDVDDGARHLDVRL